MDSGTIFLSIPLVGMEIVRPKGTSEQVYELPGSFLDGLAFLYYIGLFLFSREEMKE